MVSLFSGRILYPASHTCNCVHQHINLLGIHIILLVFCRFIIFLAFVITLVSYNLRVFHLLKGFMGYLGFEVFLSLQKFMASVA